MVGIAFEGGGLKGSYEIGAYYAIRDCKIKIKGFCGTSIGAFNAAIIASGNEEKLLKFWSSINPGELMGLDSLLVKGIVNNKKDSQFLKGIIKSVAKIIKNKGIDITLIKNHLDQLVDEDKIRQSKYDFGLVTLKRKALEPLILFKEDIPSGKIKEYIIASSYWPIFKPEKIIDDNKYLDGGFYDNCPVNMLIDKGYDKIYAIKDNGIGIVKKPKKSHAKIITIEPSRNICSIFELNPDKIKENIVMGYYDAIRKIKKHDGNKYSFKAKKAWYFKRISRRIDAKEIKRVKDFLKTKTLKDTIVMALEYVMRINKEDYYQLLTYSGALKKAKNYHQTHFIFEFVKKLK